MYIYITSTYLSDVLYAYSYTSTHTHMYIHIYIYTYICTQTLLASLLSCVVALLSLLTVPQKGYAKRGSIRQITNHIISSDLKVTLNKSLKSNLFLEPLLAYPCCGTVKHSYRYVKRC